MYNVSEDYINALEQKVQDYKLNITIDGASYNESVIVGGSFTITNQCSESDIVQIGSVYCAELKMTIASGTIQRNTWEGAIITAEEGIHIKDEEGEPVYEYVPLGIFTVAQADHTEDGVQIVAYDNMLKFDKDFNLSTTVGTAYSILSVLCEDCGVVLGMTEGQIRSMANGTQTIALYSENDCETYRDVVYWVALTLCSFATIGRDGKLYLREYPAISEAVETMDDTLRFEGGSFSDFVTAYTGVGYTDIDSQEYIYVSEGVDDKLTYNLGANPFMQYGTGTTRKQMALNILRKLKNIAYTPFRTGYLNTPAYDLGDVIQNTEGIADNSYCCVMWFEYNFSTGIQVEGFGQNPSLATARNKTDKEMAGIMSKTDRNSTQFYTFKNVEEQVVADGQTKELIYIRFATMEARQVTFQAEILCDAEADVDEIKANIQYYLNNALVSDYQPTETWSEDGKHIINLYYLIDVEPQTIYQWSVRLNSDGGTITVPVENARGTIWGQGLVTNAAWDGYIDAEDIIHAVKIDDNITVAVFSEEIEVGLYDPILIEAEDTFSPLAIDDHITIAPFEDIIYFDKTPIYYNGYIWNDLKDSTWGAVFDEHVW